MIGERVVTLTPLGRSRAETLTTTQPTSVILITLYEQGDLDVDSLSVETGLPSESVKRMVRRLQGVGLVRVV